MSSKEQKIRPMSRDAYDAYIKTVPKGLCLLCAWKTEQIVLREWKYWVLIQSISPYFPFNVMLCPKRHVTTLAETSTPEQKEFWSANTEIVARLQGLGVKKIRTMLHVRDTKETEASRSKEHLHIHYHQFKDGDFRALIPKNAHKQDLRKYFLPQ